MGVENCPFIGALVSGYVEINGEKVPVEISRTKGDFVDESGDKECILEWMIAHKDGFRAAAMHCRSCRLFVKMGKFEGVD